MAPGNTSVGEPLLGRNVSPEHATWWKFDLGAISYGYVPQQFEHFQNYLRPRIGFLDRSGYAYAGSSWQEQTGTSQYGATRSGYISELGNGTNGAAGRVWLGSNPDQPTNVPTNQSDNTLGFGLVDTAGFGSRPATYLNIGWYRGYATDTTLPNVSAGAAFSKWARTPPTQVTLTATDNGTGVTSVGFEDPAGINTASPQQIGCPVSGQTLCPFTGQATFPLRDVPEGRTTYTAIATDAAGLTRRQDVTAAVDQTAPELTLDGSLENSRDLSIRPGAYTVSAKTVDGLSGVKSIEFQLDGQQVKIEDTASDCDGCGKESAWTFQAQQANAGQHVVEVIARDFAGNEKRASFIFKVDGRAANQPPVLRPLENSVVRIDGASAGDHAGSDVDEAGDFNGDGRTDYLVGAADASPNGRTNAGAAYVVYGTETPVNVDLASLTTAQGFRISGAAAGDRLGTAAAGIGDFNGDGFDDIAIGAPRTNGSRFIPSLKGSVYIIAGAEIGGNIDLASPSSSVFSRIDGPTGNILPSLGGPSGTAVRPFGSVIADAETAAGGDVNGDELSDVTLGASDSGAAFPIPGKGAAFVIFGNASAGNVDASNLGSRGFRMSGSVPGELVGQAVTVADVNADGMDDVLVSAPNRNASGRSDAGTVYVVYGREQSFSNIDLGLVQEGVARVYMGQGEKLGHSLSALGDVNGDNIADFAVGGQHSRIVFGSAASTDDLDIASNATRSYAMTIAGNSNDKTTVGRLGDVDRDGRNDVIVGNPEAAGGGAWVVYGQSNTANVDLLTLAGEKGYRLSAGASVDRAGASVASGGDVRSLGTADAAVGAPNASHGGRNQAGSVYIDAPADAPRCVTDPEAGGPSSDELPEDTLVECTVFGEPHVPMDEEAATTRATPRARAYEAINNQQIGTVSNNKENQRANWHHDQLKTYCLTKKRRFGVFPVSRVKKSAQVGVFELGR